MPQQFVSLTGGAFMTLLLLFAGGGLGPAGIFLNMFVPLPAAFVHMRSGTLVGGGVVILTVAVLLSLGDLGGSIGYLLQFGLLSFVLPLLIRRKWNWDRAVVGGTLVVLGVATLVMAGYTIFRDFQINEFVNQYVSTEVEKAIAIYQEADRPVGEVEEFRSALRYLADFWVRAYPGLAIVLTGALHLFVVWVLSAFSATRDYIVGVPFRLWKAPDRTIWALIFAGFGMLAPVDSINLVALNMLVVLLPVYFLQGVAVVTFFFQKKGIPPLFRILGYFFIAVFNPLPIIVTGIGVFDLWADFRKPRIKKT